MATGPSSSGARPSMCLWPTRRSRERHSLPAVGDEWILVDRLQAGDDEAFAEMVRRHQPQLLRLAHATVGSHAVAEEVVQDTWLAVVRGVEGFEGRSSLKTWLFRILLNRARSAATKEQRAGRPDDEGDVERFDATGAWVDPPELWSDRVDDRIVAQHLAARVVELLPELNEA